MLCKITLQHSLFAMALTLLVALLVASIGARRAINIEPAQSLREV
jgi:putative ABC transport system permease protein